MKHAFYFRFYKIFHSETICCILANIAYAIYCGLFVIKKFRGKKEVVTMSSEKAIKIIETTYPRLSSIPEYINPKRDKNIDLSIVIPVYNHADTLEENILSILNQKTNCRYEAIFVDDGSTDGARDILKKYENNPKVKIVYQENGGIASARNTGINIASGKYLMFVDCDDLVDKNMVEVMVPCALEKNLDMVIAAHELVKEKEGIIYSVTPNICPSYNLIGYKNGDEIMNYPGFPWGKIYKRELWDSIRFFPGYWYEDTIIQMLIFTQVKSYKYTPTIVYDYKWYDKNFTSTQEKTKNRKAIDRYWLMKEIIEKYNSLGLPNDESYYTLILRHFSSYYYSSIKNLDSQIIDALFVLACDEVNRIKVDEKIKLPYILRQTRQSFVTKNRTLWELTSQFQ